MTERPAQDRLDAVLASVGQHLVVEADENAARLAPGRTRGRHRLLLVAAVVVIVATAALASIAPARRVVSDWLRAGNIEVEIDPRVTVVPSLPSFIDGARPLHQDELAIELGLAVPDLSESLLGQPSAWWSTEEPGVVGTWAEEDTSLWVVASSETFPGALEKWVRDASQVTALPTLGDGGYAVGGAHVFDTPYRRTRAQSVVAWTEGPLTFRLDSSMPRARLIAVAQSIVDGGELVVHEQS